MDTGQKTSVAARKPTEPRQEMDTLDELGKDFVAHLNSMTKSDYSYSNFIVCANIVADFFQIDQIRKYLRSGLAKILDSPTEDFESLSRGHYMRLLSGDTWDVNLSLVKKGEAKLISTCAANTMLSVVGPNSLTIDTYSLPEDFDLECGCKNSADNRLRKHKTHDLNVGDKFFIKCDELTASFHNEDADTYVLRFQQSKCLPAVTWVYDKESLVNIGTVATNPIDTEMEICIKTLAALKAKDSANLFSQLTDYDAHFVRWAAIQGLSKVDKDLCVAALRNAMSDRHPEVKTKAHQILEHYNLIEE